MGLQPGGEDFVHVGILFAEMHPATQRREDQAVGTPTRESIVYAQARTRITGSGKRQASPLANATTDVRQSQGAQSAADGRHGLSPST